MWTGLLTAPQLTMERADVLWRALKAYRESKADFSDGVIVELGVDAGCSKTVTFDRPAGAHPGFEALRQDKRGRRGVVTGLGWCIYGFRFLIFSPLPESCAE